MERQISHLVRLVDDLLEVSRITRGIIDIQRDTLDVRDIIRAAVETSRPSISSATHTLHLELPPTPLAVSGDAIRLTQVFANLLNNAAKYTNAGGNIYVSARAEPTGRSSSCGMTGLALRRSIWRRYSRCSRRWIDRTGALKVDWASGSRLFAALS